MPIEVHGEAKIGIFRLSFIDLMIRDKAPISIVEFVDRPETPAE